MLPVSEAGRTSSPFMELWPGNPRGKFPRSSADINGNKGDCYQRAEVEAALHAHLTAVG